MIVISGRLAGLLTAESCSVFDCCCLSRNSGCAEPQRVLSAERWIPELRAPPRFRSSSPRSSGMANDSVKLSKNLLRMKFMQRGLDAETKKQLEEDEKRIISDEHWYLDLPELKAKENLIIEEKSFVPCEELKYGRISFKGFNPEVEKLMALMNPKDEEEKQEAEEISRMQADVTDEEMALRYESLVASMKKKFAKKRQRAAIEEEDVNQNVAEAGTKRAFLKPQD